MPFLSSDRVLALLCIVLACLALFLWLPFDIETGLIEKVRRQVRIGDRAMPTLALGIVILGGFLTFVSADPKGSALTARDIGYLGKLILTLVLCFVLMRWLGPLAVQVFGDGVEYRALRDTVPWKYIGFLAGGTALVAGLMALVEGRLTLRGLIIGLLSTVALIAIYDLPFEDLLLPPNGDV